MPEPAGTPAGGRRPRRRLRLLAALAAGLLCLLAVAAVAGAGGTPVGAADNGDGQRLYCGAGLAAATPDGSASWKGGVVLDFDRVEPCPDPIPSSALLVLRAAVSGDGPVSLTQLGWTYALIAAVSVAAATWAATTRGLRRGLVLLPPLLPLLNTDFTRFVVSTYSEPAALLGAVLLLCGLAVVAVTGRSDRAGRLVALGLLAGGGLLAATAKPGFAPLLGVAAVVCSLTVLQWGRRRRWTDRVAGPVVAGAVLLAGAGPIAASLSWQAAQYGPVNAYNLTYTLVLAEVPGSARELGLPAAAAGRAGNGWYPDGPDGVPGADVVAADPTAARDRAWQVLADEPAAAARALGVAVQATQGRALDYLPDQPWTPATEGPGLGTLVGAQGAREDQLRSWLDGMAVPWLPSAALVAGIAAGLAGLRWRHPVGAAATRTAGVAAASSLGLAALAVLGDGYFEIAKHVWLSAYLIDVSVLATGAAVLTGLAALTRARRTPGAPGR